MAVAASIVALAWSPAVHGQSPEFRIPLVVDFEDERYAEFHTYLEERVRGEIIDGKLVVVSDADPGSCRFAQSNLLADGPRAVHVDVDVRLVEVENESSLMVGAGLMLRYSNEGSMRFMALLANNTGYEIVVFGDGRARQRISSTVADREGGGPMRLAARESGAGAEFYVDGRRVGSLSDSGVTGRVLGVIHCGPGRFVFDDYGLNTTGNVGFEVEAGAAQDAPQDELAVEPASVTPSPPVQPQAASGPPALPGSRATPPPLPSADYWYESGGQPQGPISLPVLRRLAAEGALSRETLTWKTGEPDWRPAGSREERIFD